MAIGLNDIVDFLPHNQRCKPRRWSSALMVGTLLATAQIPVLARETETRHAMAAMAAFAECKIRHSGYSQDRAQTILKTWIKNKGLEKEAEWLQSPQAIHAVNLISEAMNKTCNGFDQSSPQFIPAMEAIDDL